MAPTAGFKFNEFTEVKSHSSVLFNERVAFLFYWCDIESVNMMTSRRPEHILKVYGYLKQIYMNVRVLLRYNPQCRVVLNLKTADDGIYVPDVAFAQVEKMIAYCRSPPKEEKFGWTENRVTVIIDNLNTLQMLLRDILQYFQYFIRANFQQKPDIEKATELYQSRINKMTLQELRDAAGKNNKIDFEALGMADVGVFEPKESDNSPEDELADEGTHDE